MIAAHTIYLLRIVRVKVTLGLKTVISTSLGV